MAALPRSLAYIFGINGTTLKIFSRILESFYLLAIKPKN